MSREHLEFSCEGNALIGTLDTATEQTGLLIVSGGNEVRAGPWNSQAMLAAQVAAAGFPVFRFDRRGIGDSEGANGGFETSTPDIEAAVDAFRTAAPHLTRVVAFGNCDAASALLLAECKGVDGLVLANPWTFDAVTDEVENAGPSMTPQRLRAHYLRRLADPRAWMRLLSGKVSVTGLASSLKGAAAADAPPTSLAKAVAAGIAAFGGPVSLLVAGRDRTGLAFLDHWDRADPRLQICADATHSFVEPEARRWLENRILEALCGS